MSEKMKHTPGRIGKRNTSSSVNGMKLWSIIHAEFLRGIPEPRAGELVKLLLDWRDAERADLMAACERAVTLWKIRLDVQFRQLGLPTPASVSEQPEWVVQCLAALSKATTLNKS